MCRLLHKRDHIYDSSTKRIISGGSYTKGINMWRILHKKTQHVGEPPQKGIIIPRLPPTRNQYAGVLHQKYQDVEAPPHMESICRKAPERESIREGSSTIGINLLRILHKRESMCVGSLAKGIHIWRFLRTMNQYVAMLHKKA